MYLTKLQISNTCNDNLTFIWKISTTESENSEWIQEKRDEMSEYNSNTNSGRMSTRYYYFETYTLEQFLVLDMSSLDGLRVIDLFNVFKSF